MNLSKVISYAYDIFSLVVTAEQIFGRSQGAKKKEFVESVQRDMTDVFSRRFGAVNELDPYVKQLRPHVVDAAVAVANWRGLFPTTMGQRITAGLDLGHVQLPIVDLYAKLQKGAKLDENEQKQWDEFVQSLPAGVHDVEDEPAIAQT